MNFIKRNLFILLLVMVNESFSQVNSVGINTNIPNPNAVLDLVSPEANQGLLVPRLTTAERIRLSFGINENGLIVFDKTERLFYYWNDTEWVPGLGIIRSGVIAGDLVGEFPNLFIKPGAVTTNKLATQSVRTDKIEDYAITSEKIGQDAVTTDKVANGAIIGTKLETLTTIEAGTTFGNQFSVVEIQLDNKGRVVSLTERAILITSSNVENLSLLNEDIANGTIKIEKIDPDGNTNRVLAINSGGQVFWENRSSFVSSDLQNNSIFIGNSQNVAEGKPVIGDIKATNLSTGADFQINPSAVTTTEILDETITIADIGTNAVGLDEIAPSAVASDELVDGSIQSVDIANDAVTKEKVNADVAGLGLSKNSTDASLQVNLGNGLRFDGDDIETDLNAIAGDGLVDNGNVIDVNVDDITLETVSDVVRIKASGVRNNELANDAVTSDKILDNEVSSDDIADNTLLNEDVNAAAAIEGTKIDPDFGAQNVTTTGTISGGTLTDGVLSTANGNVTGVARIEIDNITIDGNTISSTNTNSDVILNPNGNGNVNASNAIITNVNDPVDLQDAATKNYVDTEITDAENSLQAELDATQVGAGLNTDGSYITNAGTNYIDAASSLDNADDLLDAAIKANEDAIAADGDTDATNELSDLQLTGTTIELTNAAAGATGVDLNMTFTTDAELGTETTNRSNADAALQTEIDDTQTGAGLAANGNYNTNTGTNYIDAASSLDNADVLLDAAVAAVQADVDANETDGDAADAALQTELDDTQTGAGLAANGNYNANTGTNYIDAASSLDNADDLLDAAIKANEDAIAADDDTDATNELSDIELNGTSIQLTNPATENSSIDLDAAGFATDAELASLSVEDADADPTNENQTVSAGTGITIAQSGQDFEVAVNGSFEGVNISTTGTVSAGATTISGNLTFSGGSNDLILLAPSVSSTTELTFPNGSGTLLTDAYELGTFPGTTVSDNVTIKGALDQLDEAISEIDASEIQISPITNMTSSNVQDALEEIQTDLDNGSLTVMFKSTYDSNNDNVVDMAETVQDNAITVEKLGTAGSVDGNKIFTTDPLGNPVLTRAVGFEAFRASDQSNFISGNPVIFDNEVFDTHNAFNIINGTYTVPRPGMYQINASVSVDYNLSGVNRISLFVNGSEVARSAHYASSSSPAITLTINKTLILGQNDVLAIRYTNGLGDNVDKIEGSRFETHFSGHLVR